MESEDPSVIGLDIWFSLGEKINFWFMYTSQLKYETAVIMIIHFELSSKYADISEMFPINTCKVKVNLLVNFSGMVVRPWALKLTTLGSFLFAVQVHCITTQFILIMLWALLSGFEWRHVLFTHLPMMGLSKCQFQASLYMYLLRRFCFDICGFLILSLFCNPWWFLADYPANSCSLVLIDARLLSSNYPEQTWVDLDIIVHGILIPVPEFASIVWSLNDKVPLWHPQMHRLLLIVCVYSPHW